MKRQTKLPQQDKLDIVCTITLTANRGTRDQERRKYKGIVTEYGYYKIVTATMRNNVLQEYITPWQKLPADAEVAKLSKPYTYVIANSDASVK